MVRFCILFLLALAVANDNTGVIQWTRISGTLDVIPNDQGTVNQLPQYQRMATAQLDSVPVGYAYAGRGPGVDNLCDYLYQIDLERGNVTKISGSSAFAVDLVRLPQIGVPERQAPPPKDGAALWYSKREFALYAFGGYSRYKKCTGNDFWMFNLSSLNWTWISGDFECSVASRLPKYGTKGVANYSNYPGAKRAPAYWENHAKNMLYLHGGSGAYSGSLVKTSDPNVFNEYSNNGADVWAYDLIAKIWIWIAGPSTSNPPAISTAPGTQSQTPGGSWTASFGKSNDGNVWLLESGSTGTYWLWNFDTNTNLWIAKSQVNLAGRPPMRSNVRIGAIGRNTLIVHSGCNISDCSYRLQDLWSFYIPTESWSLISGNPFSNLLTSSAVQDGSNIPNIGESSNLTILPGIVLYGSIAWKNSLVVFSGFTTKHNNLVMKLSICDSNEIFNTSKCIRCPYGRMASDLIDSALEVCQPLCIEGAVWDGMKCLNCSAGKFGIAQNSECKSCLPGYFSQNSTNSACSPCLAGFYTENFGFTYCDTCLAGYYSREQKASSCLPCSLGSISTTNGSSFCVSCISGTYSSKDKQTFCELCSPGFYAPLNESSRCIPCSSGSISPKASSKCLECPIGKYSGIEESNVCIDCGNNTETQRTGSKSLSECFCKSEYYGNPLVGISCLECVKAPQIRCYSNSTYPSISSGYFRSPQNPNLVLECIPHVACLETNSDSLETPCSIGYTGWICGSCVPFDFYKLGSSCLPCPSYTSKILIGLILAIICTAFIWKLFKLKDFYEVIDLKVIVFWIQIIALFPQLSSSWPPILKSFFRFLSVISFDIDIASPECSFHLGFWHKYYAKLMLPLFFILLYMIRVIIWHRCSIRFETLLKEFSFIFVVIVSVFSTVIYATLLSPFSCKFQPDGSYVVWNSSSVLCYEKDWLNVHLTPMIIFIILYFFVFIGLLLKAYRVYDRKTLGRTLKRSANQDQNLYAYLVRSYRPKTYWWEMVHLIKRILIITCGAFLLPYQGTVVYVVIFFILLGFLFLDIVVHPYERKAIMKMSLLWNAIALMIMSTDGFVFKSENASESTKMLFSILCILMCIIGLVVMLVYNYRWRISRIKKRIFDGNLQSYDPLDGKMSVRFQPDADLLKSYQQNTISGVKIKINMDWKVSAMDAQVSTSAAVAELTAQNSMPKDPAMQFENTAASKPKRKERTPKETIFVESEQQ